MLTATKSSVHQHDTLRVPSGWNDQARAFVVQLEGILDDLYKRFGRIRFEDLSEAMRSQITTDEADMYDLQGRMTEAEGDIDDLEQTAVTAVSYGNSRLRKTINGTTTDIVTLATMKTDMSLNNVENKSSATIRSEITSANVTSALGYTPLGPGTTWGQLKNV